MSSALLIPLFLGAITILQGGLNQYISKDMGLTMAGILGSIVTLVIFVAFYFVVKLNPNLFPDFVQIKAPHFKLWYLIPGIFGFCILLFMPWAIIKLGALKVTVGLVAAQMITSVCWDIFVAKIPLNSMRIMGMIFAFISVSLVTYSK